MVKCRQLLTTPVVDYNIPLGVAADTTGLSRSASRLDDTLPKSWKTLPRLKRTVRPGAGL